MPLPPQTYPQPGQSEDINQINAILQNLASYIGGSISQDDVQKLTPSPISQDSAIGDTAIALGNHTHAVQGLEAFNSDPDTGNFLGREYFNPASKKTRLCIDPAGTGTWVTTGNLDSTELVDHASQHATGGADPLPDNMITERMMGRGIAYDNPLPADVNLGNAGWAAIWPGITFTCHGDQLVLIVGVIALENTTASIRNAHMRFTEAAAPLQHFPVLQVNGTGSTPFNRYSIMWAKVFADGVHTLVLEGYSNGDNLHARKQITSDAAHDVSYLQAIIG